MSLLNKLNKKLEEAIPTVEKEDIHEEIKDIYNTGQPNNSTTNTNIEKEIVGTDTTDNLPDIKKFTKRWY